MLHGKDLSSQRMQQENQQKNRQKTNTIPTLFYTVWGLQKKGNVTMGVIIVIACVAWLFLKAMNAEANGAVRRSEFVAKNSHLLKK